MEQDEFQMEFQSRLQQAMGKLMFDNMGQQLRMEYMAREAALLNHEIGQLKAPAPPAEGEVK